jgi:FtsP/CotA-like multicopper oxidase with cupredoxin domain
MSTLEKSKKRSGALSRKLWRVLILVPLMLGAACGMNQGRHMDHGGQGDMHEGMPPQVLDLPPTEGPLDSATFVDTNPDPRIVEVNLEARPAEVEYLPGKRTVAWTYNGALPGPRLEARVGDKVVVNFRNSLPEPTTIHWHGLRIPAEMDGTAAMQSPIPPGGTFQYVFELRDGLRFL